MASTSSGETSSGRRYSVHEVLRMLEEDDFVDAAVYITPPGEGLDSDEDSGEEEGATLHNLNRQQLVAEAQAQILLPDGQQVELDEAQEPERHDVPPAHAAPPPPPEEPRRLQAPRNAENQAQQRQQQMPRTWRHEDLPRDQFRTQRPWEPVPSPRFLEQDLNPLELFELFFDDEVIDVIVQQTNLYASRDKGNHAFNTNREDIHVFLGIILLSGYVQLPRRCMYWELNTDCHNSAVSAAMTRNGFEDHLRYIHLADNNNLHVGDKLAKVRNFLALINERCFLFFPLQRDLCVYESMVPYFGRHSIKQFIRGKPIRFGYKLWCLADPMGYIVQFEPYAGGRGAQGYGRLGLGGTVVLDLISELPERPFHLTFDNYFTSLRLLAELADAGIGATGTIRKNRTENCPLKDSARLAKDPRGAIDFRRDRRDNILVVEWNDNSVVTLATNCDHVEPQGQVRRWCKQQRNHINVHQPSLIKVYNTTMGGVDRADQNISKYRAGIRTKKWWWPFFANTIELCLQNAWLLYRKSSRYLQEPLDLLAFRRQIAQVYLMRNAAPALPQRAPPQPPTAARRVPAALSLDRTGHFSGDSNTQRRCALCHRNTRKMCQKCQVGLHLHCFNQFHGVN